MCFSHKLFSCHYQIFFFGSYEELFWWYGGRSFPFDCRYTILLASPLTCIHSIQLKNLCICHVWWNLDHSILHNLVVMHRLYVIEVWVFLFNPLHLDSDGCIMELTNESLISHWLLLKGSFKTYNPRVLKIRKMANPSLNQQCWAVLFFSEEPLVLS